mmetsp:Transcript_81856/g.128922  ORF Transcript_81856/g.128922 Transcript_81856/m.128922 type:complete len:179 (-) Transcript_81856:53-589(-)|eukprot:CAMPEP_0169305906 /NCGR_PEP_ID=MMETSP1017-20121227/414_1 /TAXON_ID=342587 /ORGANISM="Karlodinium micrum, Strain CCMP2283" /LENGTH=178 /DNA_ID=CAMNT_0009398969 /DNA_START=54 /DNA_END=590 /DNA_ORIENTATION=-
MAQRSKPKAPEPTSVPVGSSLPTLVAGMDARSVFHYYDTDADGRLTQDEFVRALQAAGAAPSAADFEEACRATSRTPNLNEFLDALKSLRRKRPTSDTFCEKFRVSGLSQDGTIDADVLRHIVTQYGEKLSEVEVDELMRIAVPNKDGRISLQTLGEALLPDLSVRAREKEDSSVPML